MRQFQLETNEASAMVAQPPQPKVDFNTGEITRDRDSGETLMTVDVMYVAPGEKPEVISIMVLESGIAGELVMGTPVALTRLIARHWENTFNGEKRCGHTYRAVAITPLAEAGKGKAA